jgi:hypothetical protein
MRVWRHPAWHVPVGQLALRAAVVVGALGGLLGAGLVGTVPAWLAVLAGVLTVVAVVRPESPAGLGLELLVGLTWLLLPPGAVTSPLLLVAAAGMVVVHVGLLVAAQGPAVMAPDPAQLRLWARRAAGLWAVAALLWVAAISLRGASMPRPLLVAALGVVVAGLLWGTRRIAQGPAARP